MWHTVIWVSSLQSQSSEPQSSNRSDYLDVLGFSEAGADSKNTALWLQQPCGGATYSMWRHLTLWNVVPITAWGSKVWVCRCCVVMDSGHNCDEESNGNDVFWGDPVTVDIMMIEGGDQVRHSLWTGPQDCLETYMLSLSPKGVD